MHSMPTRLLALVACLAGAAACSDRGGQAMGDGGRTECVTACDGGGGQPTGCPGEQPLLEECFVGDFFAECGGEGEPRLACGGFDDCRWFTGGCIAYGYVASDCPAADICCHERGSGDDVERWPWGDERYCPDLGDISEPFESLWFHGTLPWDRGRGMVLATTVSESLQPGSLTCFRDAADYAITWCDGGQYHWTSQARLGDTLVIGAYPGTSDSSVWIEIDLAASAGPTARACISSSMDAVHCDCPGAGMSMLVCAESGTLVLSASPVTADDLPGLRFEIEATLANGAVLSGGVALP